MCSLSLARLWFFDAYLALEASPKKGRVRAGVGRLWCVCHAWPLSRKRYGGKPNEQGASRPLCRLVALAACLYTTASSFFTTGLMNCSRETPSHMTSGLATSTEE